MPQSGGASWATRKIVRPVRKAARYVKKGQLISKGLREARLLGVPIPKSKAERRLAQLGYGKRSRARVRIR